MEKAQIHPFYFNSSFSPFAHLISRGSWTTDLDPLRGRDLLKNLSAGAPRTPQPSRALLQLQEGLSRLKLPKEPSFPRYHFLREMSAENKKPLGSSRFWGQEAAVYAVKQSWVVLLEGLCLSAFTWSKSSTLALPPKPGSAMPGLSLEGHVPPTHWETESAPRARRAPQTPLDAAHSRLPSSLVKSPALIVFSLPDLSSARAQQVPPAPGQLCRPGDGPHSRAPLCPSTGRPAFLFTGADGDLQEACRRRCLEKQEGFEAQGEPAWLWFTFFTLILTSISAP